MNIAENKNQHSDSEVSKLEDLSCIVKVSPLIYDAK
jgi:hypothetical protein